MSIVNRLCVPKPVIRILCASLAYKKRVLRIHSGEGIKQDCDQIDINPLITHPIHQRLNTPVGLTSPTLFEQQSVGSYTSHTDTQISEDSESVVKRGKQCFVPI